MAVVFSEETWSRLEIAYAETNRNLGVGLAGTGVAVMTFLILFGYDSLSRVQVDSLLFQATLGVIVLSIFLFVISATFYYYFMVAFLRRRSRAGDYIRRADLIFILGVLTITLEPAMILFTANLTEVATLALVFWVGLIAMQVFGWHNFTRAVSATANQSKGA